MCPIENSNCAAKNSHARSPELHTGHRERLRQRFSVNRGKDFSDHELLEMLLFYTIPRLDTNELAHKLINKFGSLSAVINADPEKLKSVPGIGNASATFFELLFVIKKRIDLEKYKNDDFIADSLSLVGAFLLDYYKGRYEEEFCAMLLDNGLKLIEFWSISKGSVNSTSVDVRSIAKHALTKDASYIILSHNHPSGLLNQSSDDRLLTSRIDAALHAIGITLIDHIIVNDEGYMPTMHARIKDRIPEHMISSISRFYDT